MTDLCNCNKQLSKDICIRVCKKCNLVKKCTEFYKNRSHCTACRIMINQAFYTKNKNTLWHVLTHEEKEEKKLFRKLKKKYMKQDAKPIKKKISSRPVGRPKKIKIKIYGPVRSVGRPRKQKETEPEPIKEEENIKLSWFKQLNNSILYNNWGRIALKKRRKRSINF